MNSAYVKKLGLKTWKTNVQAQKINGSILKIFRMVIVDFQVENKIGKPSFFQKTFLVANSKFEVILRMLFLKISNTNVLFGERSLA